MIYIDTSVLLAQLLAEDKVPPARLWEEPLVASRLLEYETWNRIHALKLRASHSDAAQNLLGRISFIAMSSPVLARALEPFPVAPRTLDALHLATIAFLQKESQQVTLATYDERMLKAARSLRIPIYDL